MSRSPSAPDATESPPSHESEAEDLKQLRRLILGPVQDKVGQLEKRLDDRKLRASDVSEVLPEALSLRGPRDRKLLGALVGAVEEIVKSSVQRDRHVLAEALAPVVSLAVRKSVAEFFQRIIQSVNETLEVSWSWRGLKWRLEAFKTGKSFAEIVLLHTLEYRVEQVFLIHAQSGLLIEHVTADPAKAKEPDLVSAMLKAIQDFMSDSFGAQVENRLDVIAFGDLSIWLENGPEALLAGVVRGTAPQELRERFRGALEQIHAEKSAELASFSGDSSAFDSTRPILEDCLVVQRKTPQSKVSPTLRLALTVVALLLAIGIFVLVRDWLRWTSYIRKLEAEPGIVVLTAERNLLGFSLSGLRDPLAIDPADLLRQSGLDADKVSARWAPYLALDPHIALERARLLLSPPSTVTLKMEGGVLVMEGSASHAWISRSRDVAKGLLPVNQVRTAGLEDLDLRELDRLRTELAAVVIRFRSGSADLQPGAERTAEQALQTIRSCFDQAERSGVPVRLTVVGHSDPSGLEATNAMLSQERADRIRGLLLRAGLDAQRITAKGAGTAEPVPGPAGEPKERNRSATLRMEFED